MRPRGGVRVNAAAADDDEDAGGGGGDREEKEEEEEEEEADTLDGARLDGARCRNLSSCSHGLPYLRHTRRPR